MKLSIQSKTHLSFTMSHDYSSVQNSGALYPLCTLSSHATSISGTGYSLNAVLPDRQNKCRFYFKNMVHVKCISNMPNDRSSSCTLLYFFFRRTREKYCFTVTDLFKKNKSWVLDDPHSPSIFMEQAKEK